MDEKKVSIFEPKDKLSEKERYYFEWIPQHKYYMIKKHFPYDKEMKLYYSNNPDDVKDYAIKHIDLFHLADELEMKYDKEKKRWYTYKGNDKINEKFYI
jgi:hypothetical protein